MKLPENKTVIKPEILEKALGNSWVRMALIYRFGKGEGTIVRWLNTNNPMLTSIDALNIFKEGLHVPLVDLTEEIQI